MTVGDPERLEEDFRGEIGQAAKVRVYVLVTILLDVLLLAAWRVILTGFDWIVHVFGGDPVDLGWQIAHYALGAFTLILVLLYLFWDIRSTNDLLREKHKRNRRKLTGGAE